MEGKKILRYPDRLSPQGRDDTWDMGLGAWPCSAVLQKGLTDLSPTSSSRGDCHTPQAAVSDHEVLWEAAHAPSHQQTGTMSEQE